MLSLWGFYLLHWPLTQNTLVCARPHQKHINGMVFMTTLMRYSLEALLVSIDNPRIIFGLSGHPSSYRCFSNGVVVKVMIRRQLPLFQALDAKLGYLMSFSHMESSKPRKKIAHGTSINVPSQQRQYSCETVSRLKRKWKLAPSWLTIAYLWLWLQIGSFRSWR